MEYCISTKIDSWKSGRLKSRPKVDNITKEFEDFGCVYLIDRYLTTEKW